MFDISHRVTGPELRRLRRRAGLTQRGLAERLELHPNYLAQLERGEVPIREVVALAAEHVCSDPKPKGGRKHD